jgi:hypothetical protein
VATINLARTGQAGGTGDALALFLRLGISELISAFDTECVFKNYVRTRNITGGRSAKFPVTGRASAAYHTPGVNIAEMDTNVPSDMAEEEINLDALIVAPQKIYDLDQAMAYYDVRQDLTHQAGEALSIDWDQRAARVIYAAAQRSTPQLAKAINADRVGTALTLSAGYAAATKAAKGDELISLIGNAKVAMKKKRVPTKDLICAVPPDEYDFLLESTRAINADFNGGGGGNGTIADGSPTLRIKGIRVIESIHVTQSAYTNVTGDRNAEYAQNLTKCRALIWHKDAIGVLTLKKPQLEMTDPSGDFFKMYQSHLMTAKMAIGMKSLRPECAASISIP